ncbi:class I SAM-dependent methyltransferase [Niveispirillum sp. KHB5.9]|uniref:class I SAM-dependent methyltransferase n=1 Tax=Niveispirillum sp. KHB5.9 TaxID=3400269 RepID=UPI003A852C36
MRGWTDGYVTEIGYTYSFHAELQPWSMAQALGDRSPIRPGERFDYCELGFGQGFSLALLAAANPQARFWGNDINPAHVAHARWLADGAGLSNLTVSPLGFADYADADLPGFDIVALHGVWSWVGPQQRAEIVAFLDRHLKPGGLVYLGYNVLPGWAQYLPLRELMLAGARRGEGALAARITGALGLAERLRAQEAGYFRVNPTVATRLDALLDRPVDYLAHEYFNESWHPTYFTDLAASLAPAGLRLGAQARAGDRWEEGVLAQAILTAGGRQAADDPDFAELLRDFLTNRPFRRDLFIREGGGGREQAPRRWAALGHPRDLPRRATPATQPIEVPFDAAHAVLSALQAGPVAEEALLTPLGGEGQGALAVLLALDLVAPALPDAGLEPRRESCARLNALLLADAAGADRMPALASPVTGGGVGLDRIGKLFLAGLEAGHDPAGHAWAVLEAGGQRVLRDGKPLATAAQNKAELAERWDAFSRRRLPVLRTLGAVPQ